MIFTRLYTKFIVLLFGLGTAFPVLAEPATAGEKIKKAIADVCLDSWCEGGFEYYFRPVVLRTDDNEMLVPFRMTQRYPVRLKGKEGDPFRAQINQRFYDVSCLIPGYSQYDNIMQSEDRLRWEVYLALSQCINALEKRLALVNQQF
jgi:hypothetical protein